MNDPERSLSDEATFAGLSKPPASSREVSLGDERTLGDGLSGQDTIIDDIEVVDLEARYKVEGTLGQGGMGAVLLATDTRLDRKVAIKRILGEAAGNRMAVQRFLTEAKSIAALNHPNIVQIYDYGRAKDGPFLIMEYLDGGSLLDRCREKILPLDEAIDLACQLCDGLAKAHDLGIIHRDIKPANVLLTKDGMPKLTDFGLAKAQASDHGQTMTGAVLGTPDFMPPEQRRDASEVDTRSDLWSLAATIYQMVTGRSPKIIRFKDVPESIQEVLGKALEDRKDSRYQTARELRDALKTSLLARASAAVSDVLEGKCPACGVQNDPSRKFCRGCGESLEAACLSCDMPMPMWEEICGSCGGKQPALIDDRRRTMAARQAEAEGLLGDFEFDRAIGIATLLRDEAHPRLKYLADWAVSFLEQIEKSRAEQTRHAVEAMAEAGKHVAQYDYLSAIFVLEMVPNSLRAGVLPGMRESAGAMLGRIKKTQGEASSLEARIKEQLAAKQLDELLPDVEKLATLRPDRRDLQKIRVQLIERQQKQAGARDTAIELAKASLASQDYEAALAIVAGVAPAMITPEVIALRGQAESLVRQVRELAGKIKAAVTAKRFDGLLDVVQKYLTLKPADLEVGKLRQSLVEREEKYAADIAARLQQAEQLAQACRFDDAVKLLMAIPKPRRTKRVAACLGRASRLGPLRKAAIEPLSNAKSGGYAVAIESSRPYEAAIAETGIVDAEFAGLLGNTQTALADQQRLRRLLKRVGISAAAVAAVVMITAAGLWIRSSMRAAALTSAIAQGHWDDALARDPDNVAALVGRARAKLQADPPDIDGAFADLDRAERGRAALPDANAARGDGHAMRAREQARIDRLDDAGRDLAEAKRLGAAAELVTAAREALVAGWVERAQDGSEKGDLPRLKKAVKAALGVGAAQDQLLAAWETYASARINELDVAGLTLACEESVKLGLSGETQAGWWLRIAEKAVQPPREDTAVLQKALEEAHAAGATEEAVASSRARGLLLEASSLLARGDMRSATAKAREATLLDMTVSATTLRLPGNRSLRAAMVADYRGRFDEVVGKQNWQQAVQITAEAKLVDGAASGWVEAAVAALAPAALASLAPATLASLPPTAVAKLPPLKNSIEMELKLLPAGTFIMGGGAEWEAPHQVTLTTPFYMGVNEVTNAQWKRVMGSVPSRWKDDDRPVTNVSWEDAVEFCRKVSALPEERTAGHVYRLPTEAEWEYACRAGSTTNWSYGDDESRLVEYGWVGGNSGNETHVVRQKKANAWDLYDMHGNVLEWCSDWYGEYPKGAVADPQGPSGASCRAIRGGSWYLHAWYCMSYTRLPTHDSYRSDGDLGFRVAMTHKRVQRELVSGPTANGGLAWSSLISPETLADEVKQMRAAVVPAVASASAFKGGGYDIARVSFSAIALAFGVIAAHEKDAQWEKSAEAARDLFARAGFNCKVGTDQSFAEAKARVTDLESLIEGKPIALPESREQDFRWSQVASRPSLMSRLETADGILGGAITSKVEFQKQVQRFIHEAEIVAAIGEVIMQPDFESHDDATYRRFASTLRDAAAMARDAAQKNDYESARTTVGDLKKSCNACHGDYRR